MNIYSVRVFLYIYIIYIYNIINSNRKPNVCETTLYYLNILVKVMCITSNSLNYFSKKTLLVSRLFHLLFQLYLCLQNSSQF